MILSWQFILMIVLSSLFLAWFLYRPVKSNLSDDDSNIAINKQRQAELEIDFNQGHIAVSYTHLTLPTSDLV